MKRKIVSMIIALVLCCGLAVSVSAYDGGIWDEADLLTGSEEAWLADKLSELGRQYEAEFVIMTLADSLGMYADELVEYVYDSMEFGYGQNRDGVLLLVCMDTREYRILSNGYAGDAITPYDIDCIGDVIVPYLSDGDYATAFDLFADECAYYLDGYINGYPFDFSGTLMTCLIIGLVVALIVAFSLKGQLKSVRQQTRANAYIKDGSMQLTVAHDIFLYRNVTRTRRESSNSSRSGGGGGSRSVGGGRF